MRTRTTRKVTSAKKESLLHLALEKNLEGAFYDFYTRSQLQGNTDVLRLLIDIQDSVIDEEERQSYDAGEKADEAYDEGYKDGKEQQKEDIIDDLKVVDALIICFEADDPKLKAELPEAIADVKRLLNSYNV